MARDNSDYDNWRSRMIGKFTPSFAVSPTPNSPRPSTTNDWEELRKRCPDTVCDQLQAVWYPSYSTLCVEEEQRNRVMTHTIAWEPPSILLSEEKEAKMTTDEIRIKIDQILKIGKCEVLIKRGIEDTLSGYHATSIIKVLEGTWNEVISSGDDWASGAWVYAFEWIEDVRLVREELLCLGPDDAREKIKAILEIGKCEVKIKRDSMPLPDLELTFDMATYIGTWVEVQKLDIINGHEGIRGNPSFGLEEYRLWAYEWIEAVRIKEEEKVTIDKKGIKDLIELARSFEEGICEVLIKRNIKETASSPRLASGMKDLEGTWIKASYSQVTSIRGEGWFWDFSWIEDVRISGSDRSIEFIKEKIKIILKAGECEVLIREHCENSSVGFSPEMREYRGKWIRIFGLDIEPSSGTEIVRNIGINGSRSWLWDLRWIEDARIYGRSLRKRFYKEMEFEEELVTTDPLLGKLKSISMLSSEEEL